MNSEAGEFPMQANCRFFISCGGFVASFKKSEIVYFFVGANKSSPSITIFSFVHAFNTAFVGFAHSLITKIFCVRGFSNVFPFEAVRLLMFVIYLFRRKFSGHNQPNDSVSEIHGTIYSNNPIAIVPLTSSYFAFFSSRSSTYFPSQFSRSLVIAEERSNVFGGQIGIGRLTHLVFLGGMAL
jgi:hypothetical protein